MKTLAIYLSGTEYVRRLSEYLRTNLQKEYSVVTYSKRELLFDAINKNKISVLIIEEDSNVLQNDPNMYRNQIERVIVLSDSMSGEETDECERVYKFCPASELTELLHDKSCSLITKRDSGGKAEIFSFYSPIGGIGTTSLAIACAKIKSYSKKVLYLNLNAFSGITEELYLDDRKTLSEALYCFASDSEDAEGIKKYIQKADGFDTFAAFRSFKELSEIRESVIKDFINYISSMLGYELVIIDYSSVISGLFDLLGMSDRIIITYRSGYINEKKKELLCKEMQNELSESIIDKIIYLDIPYYNNQPDNYDRIDKSPIAGLMRNIHENCG